MKQVGVAVSLGLVGLLLIVILLGWFGEGQSELRSEKAQTSLAQTRALAPLWLAVKQVLVASLGVAGASAALILAVGAIVAVLSTPNLIRMTWVRSWTMSPNRFGLYRMLFGPDGQGHLQLLGAGNAGHSQELAALVGNQVNRLSGAGQVVKQLVTNKDDEGVFEDPPPAELPKRISIYTAPLSDQLHLPVGADGSGPVQLPLRDLGSGIVGGLPGMGKSECVGSMIAGLLRQDATGERIQMAVADLKGGVDFGRIPGDLAGLAWPVAKDPDTGLQLINNVWGEIERRQKLLEQAGVARVEVYNQRPGVTPLPYLFLFVDELAMVTMAAEERGIDKATRQQSAEFNGRAVRVVSVGRALGVSMIGATQRPSGTVIPTQLRDLCGFRIAFRCMTQESSKAVLGVAGAEALPAEPGLALLMRDGAQPRMIRTYLAEIEAGRFDRFAQRLPKAQRLQLPADAEADGLEDSDMASTPSETDPETVGTGTGTVLEPVEPGSEGLFQSSAAVPVPVPAAGHAYRIGSRRRPTPVEAAAMRAHYRRTKSKTAVCTCFYGYKNEDVWAWVEQALRGEI